MKKNALSVKQFVKGAFSSSRCYAVSMSLGEKEEAEQSGFPREGSGVSHGLNSALAGRGVIVKDKAFHNLKPFELQRKGATTAGWTRLGIYRKREIKKNALVKQFVKGAFSSSRCYAVSMSLGEEEDAEQSGFPREGSGVSHGLNSALAGRGVIVKDKAFHNLKPYELQRKGATTAESLTGLPVHVRGNVVEGGGASEISKGQFGKLLKQVTTHISSIPSVYVHDGAVGPPSKCDAKIRVISDSPSAVLSLARILWKTPTRAVSHDSSPVTVYVATDISQNTREIIGLGSQSSIGFLAADIERSSLILCGKAFLDTNGVKDTLAAVAGPIISAREGIPLSARLVVIGDSVILLFAPENVIKSFSKLLVSTDASVVLSSNGVSPMFQCGDSDAPTLLKMPAALILGCADSSSSIPSASKLSPGQAVYHFLAGYQNGNFVPTYSKRPSALDSLELAKALLSKLKDNQIPSFLININEGEKLATGNELVKLVQSTLSSNIAPFEPKAGDLQKKYKSFISRKFQELPHEFSF